MTAGVGDPGQLILTGPRFGTAHPRASAQLLLAGLALRRRLEPGRWVGAHFGEFIVYALTRICLAGYILGMQSVFDIIAEPNRRAILRLLASSQRSVREIETELRMPQPTVSKHLRVLREAGFVESEVDAQRRLYRLRPEPLQELDSWLVPFRAFWSGHVDALERHLDRMDRPKPTKKRQGDSK